MGCHRVDSLSAAGLVTTWHATSADADAEAAKLRLTGRTCVVAWWDAQAPADLAPGDGRAYVREALMAAFGWLRVEEETA